MFSSSSTSTWPILCDLELNPMFVFLIVLTCEKCKVQNLDFLLGAINEVKALIAESSQIGDGRLNVVLKRMICDAPAKTMVRCTKQ